MVPESRSDLCAAGANLFCRITKNHRFPDGNKRSAVLTTTLLFAVNGHHFDMGVMELVEISRQVAESLDGHERLTKDTEVKFRAALKVKKDKTKGSWRLWTKKAE